MKGWIAAAIIIVFAGCAAVAASTTQPSAEGASIVGAWTLNKEASDPPREQSGDEHGHRGGGGSRGGHGRGGGYGRGGGRGMGGGGSATRDPEEMQRRMQAMRDLLTAADHMTITRTESLIIITAGDGRTTRLSPDGKKIKDESTGIERKTTWQSGNLVSEITGGASGKIIETYAVDTERGQLTITLRFENSHQQPDNRVVHHVYDRDKTSGG
jgi:hypothetical protein